MKFPRTYHFYFSPGVSSDDRTHNNLTIFMEQLCVLTEKLDGENQCWSKDTFHLRSEDSTGGVLRAYSKQSWANRKYLMHPDYLYYVEDITNVHSINYEDRSHTLFLIAVYDKVKNKWLSFTDVEYESIRINLPTVPVLGVYNFRKESFLKRYVENLAQSPSLLGENTPKEGVVLRPISSFEDWTTHVAKWVRKDHVTTDEHWIRKQLAELNRRKHES